MKRIYILFTLFFLTFLSSFSFADEHHDIIINDYQKKYPLKQGAFYTLNEILNVNADLNDAYLVLTGQEFHDENNRIVELLQNSPGLHIILDIQEGDGLVEEGSLTLGKNLTQNVSRLTIVNISQDVRVIRNNFLSGCIGLTNLDLSSLSQVTRIRFYFLFGCTELTNLDLPPSVTRIESYFLVGCASLTRLDLTPLSQLNQIESNFLYKCSGLTNLDLSPLSQVTQIENCFLDGCTGLTNLDLSPLSQVIQIGICFLARCTGLTHLDLSPLSQLTQIGIFFLANCHGFTTFDQIRLPAYNPDLKVCLEKEFPQGTAIGDEIREIYVEEYRLASKNTKSARN